MASRPQHATLVHVGIKLTVFTSGTVNPSTRVSEVMATTSPGRITAPIRLRPTAPICKSVPTRAPSTPHKRAITVVPLAHPLPMFSIDPSRRQAPSSRVPSPKFGKQWPHATWPVERMSARGAGGGGAVAGGVGAVGDELPPPHAAVIHRARTTMTYWMVRTRKNPNVGPRTGVWRGEYKLERANRRTGDPAD